MPFFIALAALLQSGEVKVEAPITVVQRPYAPFISPMGEPFRSQSAGDDPLARWFYQADRNRDGQLTVDEMQADAARYFKILDSDHDGEIGPEEIRGYETDIAAEVQVNSKWKRARSEAGVPQPQDDHPSVENRRDHRGRGAARGDNGVDGYQMYGLQGAARYGLLNLPEPVAGADADFNRGITLEEFQKAATQRFQLLDRKGAGRLALADLEARLPGRPKGKQVRLPDNAHDMRVGQPFPGN